MICQARSSNKQGQIHYIPAISSLKVVSPFLFLTYCDIGLGEESWISGLDPWLPAGSSPASVDLRECNARTIEAQNRGR